jgi:hypothetical protein
MSVTVEGTANVVLAGGKKTIVCPLLSSQTPSTLEKLLFPESTLTADRLLQPANAFPS